MRSAFRSSTTSSPFVIRSSILSSQAHIVNGVSTRDGGVSPAPLGMNLSFNVGDAKENVVRNRERFFGGLGIRPEDIAVPQQRHTDNVRVVSAAGSYENCDALVTNTRGIYLVVSIADCVPIFLVDVGKGVVACVHAGWRGTQREIVQRSLEIMTKEFDSDPADVLAFIGPSAGVCCYEVGEEVAGQFPKEHIEFRGDRSFLNLKSANKHQLLASGIREENVEIRDDCTICNGDIYHSFRREKEHSGRMMAVVGIATRTQEQ